MITRSIMLKNQNETVEFVSLVEQYPYSVDISAGHYIMNAKSILGMLAMGFNYSMQMDIHAEAADDLLEAVGKFVMEEYKQAG